MYNSKEMDLVVGWGWRWYAKLNYIKKFKKKGKEREHV